MTDAPTAWVTGQLEFGSAVWMDVCTVVESAVGRSTNIVSL